MTVFGCLAFAILAWLVLGLVAIRIAARFGHIWGYHFENPLFGRGAIILQTPALLLECWIMDQFHPDEDRLASGAARLMWAKFREPRANLDALLERLNMNRAA